MKNALLSVYHKFGITEFAQGLIALGFNIYASGGTAKELTKNGVQVTDVAALVGGGPILGHRVVTLSREVHAGLLAKDTPEDSAELARLGIPRIDLVCVDLYPLPEEIAKVSGTRESVIEMTDIGGPTMLRSAVKGGRVVVCDVDDYDRVLAWLKLNEPKDGFREVLATKAEWTVTQYCATSASYLSGGKNVAIFGEQAALCKYGENGWQTPAALHSRGTGDPLALDKFSVLDGTMPPSYNNWCDIDRLLQTLTHMSAVREVNGIHAPFMAVGVKHGNPCGAAWGTNAVEVVSKMMKGDPLAIFGGLVMMNFEVDASVAEVLKENKFDGIVAPRVSPQAIELLSRKHGKCRFVVNPALEVWELGLKSMDTTARFRYVRGGFLKQPNYTFVMNFNDPQIKAYGDASPDQKENMLLAWAIGSTSNSNTITIVKDGMLIGNGVGQQDRVGAADLALVRAERSDHTIKGAVAYSDSFFPFPDGPEELIAAGVSAILTSSGSQKDNLTIALCAEREVALYMIPDGVGRGFFGH